MYNVVLLEKVKIDLNDIVNYISEDNSIYAIKTVNSILKTIDILEDFPFIGKSIGTDLRLLIEKEYKYKIVYKVKGNKIYILSIFKYKNNWE